MKLTKLPGDLVDLSHLIIAPVTGELLAHRQGPVVTLYADLDLSTRDGALVAQVPFGWRPPGTVNAASVTSTTAFPYILTVGNIYVGADVTTPATRLIWTYLTKNSPPPLFLRKILAAAGRLVGWSK